MAAVQQNAKHKNEKKRPAHDDGTARSHSRLVGLERLLPVVEAEPTARPVAPPVAVVVAVQTAPAARVANLERAETKQKRIGGKKGATEGMKAKKSMGKYVKNWFPSARRGWGVYSCHARPHSYDHRDPRIPAMPGRSTSGFHRPGRHR